LQDALAKIAKVFEKYNHPRLLITNLSTKNTLKNFLMNSVWVNLATFFAALAIFISVIGLFACIIYGRARVKEIGVRKC